MGLRVREDVGFVVGFRVELFKLPLNQTQHPKTVHGIRTRDPPDQSTKIENSSVEEWTTLYPKALNHMPW